MREPISAIVDKLISTMPKDIFTVKQAYLLRELATLVLQHVDDQYTGLSDKEYMLKQNCILFLLQSMIHAIEHVERDHIGFIDDLIKATSTISPPLNLDKMWIDSIHLN